MTAAHIAIIGCTGRMGRALVRLAAAHPRMRVAAAITIPGDPLLGQDAGIVAGTDHAGVAISSALPDGIAAAVEFSSPDGQSKWARHCAAAGIPLVSGTTGLEEKHHAELKAAATRIPIVWSANMSVGVNLLLALVEQVAQRLGEDWDVEISEAHHKHKADAPSGTAKMLLDAVCRGRGRSAAEVVQHGRVGLTGARPGGQIGMHALRMGEVVGDHDVHFASAQEIVTLRHHAQSRDAFAAGALRAALWALGRPAGLYQMRDVLS